MPRPLRTALLAWPLAALLAMLWAVATPISASPDEPAHIVKAASVARGQLIGTPAAAGAGRTVQVPRYIAESQADTCFAFAPEAAADCQRPLAGDRDELIDSTTTAGLYNPVYYALVGWPTLIAGDTVGIYAMRAVSAVLVTLFFALGVGLLASWRRPRIPLATAFVLGTPMMLFLAGSVNPNALEVTTAFAVTAGMLTIVRGEQGGRLLPVVVVAASALLGLQSRGLSPLWMLVALVLPLLALDRRGLVSVIRRRSTIVAMIVIALAAVAALAWILGTSVLSPPSGVHYPGQGRPAVFGLLFVLQNTVPFAIQMIGLFGWMDTPAPTETVWVWAVALTVLLLAAVALLRGRALRTVLIALAAVILLPALAQAAFVTSGGYIWQGRYTLPVFAVLLLIAAAGLADTAIPRGRPALVLGILLTVGLAAGHLIAFAAVLKRYAAGLHAPWTALLHPQWQAPGGDVTLVLAFALVLAVAGVLAVRWMRRLPSATPGAQERQLEQHADGRA